MRKTILFITALCGGMAAFAQNQQNTLPTSGNVGIGTTAPNCKLEVVGEAHVKGRTIVDSSLYVKDSARFERDATIDGNLNVAGDVLFNQDLDVNGTIRNPSMSDPSGLNFVGVKSNGELRGLNANELLNNMYSPIGGCFPLMDVNGQIVGGLAPAWSSIPGGGPVANTEPGLIYTGSPCGARLGINTNTPQAYIDITDHNGYNFPLIQASNSNGVKLFQVTNDGKATIGNVSPQARLTIRSAAVNDPAILVVGQGAEIMKLDGSGLLYTRELKVTLNAFPDYVFSDEYPLMSLDELQRFINLNRDLPGVPTEQEILDEGGNVNELLITQMTKIEELTLYILEQEDKMKSQQEQIDELRQQIEALKAMMKNEDNE